MRSSAVPAMSSAKIAGGVTSSCRVSKMSALPNQGKKSEMTSAVRIARLTAFRSRSRDMSIIGANPRSNEQ